MGTINFGTVWVNGNTPTVVEYGRNVFNDATADTSLAVVCGGLDINNVDTGWSVTSRQCQPGAFARGMAVSGTANLDYINADGSAGIVGVNASRQLPSSHTVAEDLDDTEYDYQAIPGAYAEFYAEAPDFLILQWTLGWTTDATEEWRGQVRLFVNGTPYENPYRFTRQMISLTGSDEHDGFYTAKWWHGFYIIELGATGFYSAGLKLLTDERVRQTRVWTRSFRAVTLLNVS